MVLYNGKNIFTNFNGISPQNAILSFLIVAILRREEYADLNIILKDSLHDQSFTLKKNPNKLSTFSGSQNWQSFQFNREWTPM